MTATNTLQEEKLDALMSHIDEADVTREQNGTIIFEGYSADGLCVGIIERDGSIDWVCGKVEALA